MDAPLAVGSLLKGAALVPAALAAAAVLVLPTPRLRALAVLAALVLAPGLLLAQLAGAGTLDRIAARPLLVAAAPAVGLAAVAALAVLLARRPQALPLLALVALPFRLPLELGGQSTNLLLPLYVVVAAGSLAYAVERLRPATADRAPPQAPPARIEIALAVALVLYAAQALYSTNVDEAVKNVVFFYVPFALLLRLLVTVPWTGRLVAACLGVAVSLAVVFVVVGFWEFATRQLLLNPKVIADNEFRSYFRVNSLFFDPSVYGRFLAMVMLALATVLVWSARRRTTVLAAAALGLLWAGLVLTFSQSSFVALMVGLAVVAALRWRLRAVLAAAGGAAAAGLAALVLFPGLLGIDLASGNALDRATSGRLDLMRGGLEMFADRPLWGYGSGSFTERFRAREGVGSARAEPASHTTPITVAAEQGLVGLAAYGLVLVAALGLAFGGLDPRSPRGPPPPERVARAAVAAAFAALVAHTMLYAAFLEDPLTWTLLGAGLGLRRRPKAPVSPAAEESPALARGDGGPPGRAGTGSRSR